MLNRGENDIIAPDNDACLSEAEEKYRLLLDSENTDAESWRELGMVYYFEERYSEALDAFYVALELDSLAAINYYCLGLGLTAIADFSAAISACERAISLDPRCGDAHDQLGKVFLEIGDFERAEAAYKNAIDIDSTDPILYLELGDCFLAKSKIEAAINTYQIALGLDSENPLIFYQIGAAFAALQQPDKAAFYWGYSAYYKAEYTEAISYYQEYLDRHTQDVEVYLKLSDCSKKLGQYSEAINVYRRAIERVSNSKEIHLAWIETLQETGETIAAIDAAENALKRFPDNFSLKIVRQRLLPVLYNDISEIQHYRQRFSNLLNELIAQTDLSVPENSADLFAAISTQTNFYLQYQGYDDLKLQKQYGEFVHRVMAANFPQWVRSVAPHDRPHDKIKIGYISSFFQWHTVGIVFLGWLKQYNSQIFEVRCYYTGKEDDELTNLYRNYCDYFYQLKGDFVDIVQKIYADKLDILVFLDVGMCSLTAQIAALRLAPIQCAAWGHPVTTGLPTIDYFLSPDLLEPENAEKHYSEELIRLPNLGIYYEKPEIPSLQKTRSDWGLKTDAVVYLSCQSLFKYLPQYDIIFVEIAKRVPNAQFVFVSHWNSAITEQFRRRLKRSFGGSGLNSENCCIILPRLNNSDYLQLNLTADIGLDTFQFTGFLTTLDSLACNLPIVTCKGELMRSRQTAGIYRRIGVTETVVANEQEYLEMAVRLGLNPAFREEITNKINQNKSLLYEDQNCIQGLEYFYREAIATKGSSAVKSAAFTPVKIAKTSLL